MANDRKVKYLTIVDDVTKKRLDIHVVTAISGEEAARTLDGIAAFRVYPKAVGTDEGLDFTGTALDQWAHRHGLELKLTQLGIPMQNRYVESFNLKFQNKRLNKH